MHMASWCIDEANGACIDEANGVYRRSERACIDEANGVYRRSERNVEKSRNERVW
ncbi:hypothetical protein WN48_07165 [Eufriesea mexicana]|uniref:Uncharacterized protein n=1 Tax=Eufriesea mexicana TaxID=516756 RepID=A0A310ST28_9HYME|nr:hypothetical protein WN48_07165 [Eufriesea mexicana]